jgi:hypothetical protein
MFATWWRAFMNRPGNLWQRRRSQRYRPGFEYLEERAVPATFVVNTTADEFDGGTPAKPAGPDGLLSLREAIALANVTPGQNTIKLPAGKFTLSGGSLAADPTAGPSGDGLSVIGAGAGLTVIDGAGAGAVFALSSTGPADFSFKGLTITGGATRGDGGGINLATAGDNLTLRNVIVSGNAAGGDGGAIADFGSGARLTLFN